MKTKHIIPAIALAAVAFTTTSCSDFLEEHPKGKVTPTGFFDSQKSLDASVNALYYQVQQSQCNSNPMIPQCQGDDLTSTTGSNKQAYLSADAFEDPSDTKGLEWSWKWAYNIIQAANLLIDNAATTPVSQEAINEAMGQAYFWRAYAYFQLVRLYGPLPINEHNTPDNNATVPSSVEDVYSFIVKDLIAAEGCNLPVQYSDGYKRMGSMNVFVSEQAVKATLAAVYMNMAGYPLNKAEYYGLAADKAKEVVDGVNNGKYPNSLCSDWADVYSYGNNYSSECLLGMVFKSTPGGWSNNDSQLSSCHQLSTLQGWGDFLAERYYWSIFPEGPRKDYVYAKKQLTAEGNTVDWWATVDGEKYNGSNAVVGDYRPMFVAFTVNANAGSAAAAPYDYKAPFWGGMCIDKTHQLIRYSEVICWFAESAARSGKYTSEALNELKKVQARAYENPANVDNSDLAEAAYREHGFEVAGYACALVTRRSDEFRMNRLEEAWKYRTGPQTTVLVPAGTLTQSQDLNGQPFTYTTKEDVVVAENMKVTAPWRGENSIYMMYPPKETEKNPNLKR